jgi:mannose-6-phosphate isomerase-like protein (cupin superfamily)
MATNPPPIAVDLDRDTLIHLTDDLAVAPISVDSSFWTHGTPERTEFAEGRVVCVSDYTATWLWWERHPVGDELVLVLSGEVDFLIKTGSGLHSVTMGAGHAAVVPAGAWHRAVIPLHARLLFVTPTPARTEIREVTTAEEVDPGILTVPRRASRPPDTRSARGAR